MRIIKIRPGRAGVVLLAGALLASLASCGGGAAPAGGPVPVIVDTDMSSDDIMALCYLLERPDLSVQAITVEGTGVAHGPAGARQIADRLGDHQPRVVRHLAQDLPVRVLLAQRADVAGEEQRP